MYIDLYCEDGEGIFEGLEECKQCEGKSMLQLKIHDIFQSMCGLCSFNQQKNLRECCRVEYILGYRRDCRSAVVVQGKQKTF